MIKDSKDGYTGLRCEHKVDFLTLIQAIPGYSTTASLVAGTDIVFNGKICATCFRKHQFYKILESEGISWQALISDHLLPDDAMLIILRKTLFVIEVHYQEGADSVDEELQTCDFKRKQYLKLVAPLNLGVEYVYVLNDWFRKPEYKDLLDYIRSMNCEYIFNELPLTWLGLPTGATGES